MDLEINEQLYKLNIPEPPRNMDPTHMFFKFIWVE